MSFLSYAQNFEDVMLWRALGHIAGGCYVDVGAQHPRIDSVSRAFYERGWRGVHVEPVPAFADLLRADRSDETVLQVALAEREGSLTLNVFADTGLSTAVASYARRHEAERGYAVQRIEVPVQTLATALAPLAGKDVHWLKIDVEGFELQVLQGWDSAALRPWVMVVEATVPNSMQADFARWEPILVAAGYRFVYFDGLNRFYVAAEHAELEAAFGRPPNIFDGVELSGLASWGLCRPLIAERDALTARIGALQRKCASQAVQLATARGRVWKLEAAAREAAPRIAQLQAECDAARAKAEELAQASHHWWNTAESLTRQLDGIVGSRSWRLVQPLRLAAMQARRVKAFVARWTRPQAAPAAQPREAAAEVVMVTPESPAPPPRRLSPRAARIYADLKRAVEEGDA
ncbi:MAG TPA: FkbM family methyltransferase [Telluria sp.]|nr:FkbM family methyltransferase [Telluria sp.]